MDVLPSNFRTLLFCGIWKDDLHKESTIRTIYRFIVITLIFYVTIEQIISLIYLKDVNNMIAHLFLPLCYVGFFVKMLNFLVRRSDVIRLLKKFRSKVCRPVTLEENRITEKYFKNSATIHYYFTTFVVICTVNVIICPFLPLETSEIELPLESYNPYDTSKRFNFYLTYVLQGFTEIHAAVINSSFDTTTYGFILLTTGQFELCCYRIKSFINGGFSFAIFKQKWMVHHILLLDIVQDIQMIFIGVIVPFFMIMLIILFITIFQIYQEKILSMEFLTFAEYYSLTMLRAFLYCWFGNGLMLKSHDVANAILESDWTKFDPRDRKSLLLIIQTGQRGIKISLCGQCSLSIQTFTWIMKASYGVLNLLKSLSKE